MAVPQQASWMFKKILGAAHYVAGSVQRNQMLNADQFSIGNVYRLIRGDQGSVSWKKLMTCNPGPPKFLLAG